MESADGEGEVAGGRFALLDRLGERVGEPYIERVRRRRGRGKEDEQSWRSMMTATVRELGPSCFMTLMMLSVWSRNEFIASPSFALRSSNPSRVR